VILRRRDNRHPHKIQDDGQGSSGNKRAGRQAMAQGLSHQARFEIADCSARLPYPNGAFDVVVCIDAVLQVSCFNAVAKAAKHLHGQPGEMSARKLVASELRKARRARCRKRFIFWESVTSQLAERG
jgi:hypothetical protein